MSLDLSFSKIYRYEYLLLRRRVRVSLSIPNKKSEQTQIHGRVGGKAIIETMTEK